MPAEPNLSYQSVGSVSYTKKSLSFSGYSKARHAGCHVTAGEAAINRPIRNLLTNRRSDAVIRLENPECKQVELMKLWMAFAAWTVESQVPIQHCSHSGDGS